MRLAARGAELGTLAALARVDWAQDVSVDVNVDGGVVGSGLVSHDHGV